MSRDEKELQEESEKEEFGELLKFTAAGFLRGAPGRCQSFLGPTSGGLVKGKEV